MQQEMEIRAATIAVGSLIAVIAGSLVVAGQADASRPSAVVEMVGWLLAGGGLMLFAVAVAVWAVSPLGGPGRSDRQGRADPT